MAISVLLGNTRHLILTHPIHVRLMRLVPRVAAVFVEDYFHLFVLLDRSVAPVLDELILYTFEICFIATFIATFFKALQSLHFFCDS